MPTPIESETPSSNKARFGGPAEKPPGILPKNAQTWVIAGLSVVMVTAIAFSGGAKAKAPTAQKRQSAVIDPNAARIDEYRNRLEDETRKLAAEQAVLDQTKQAASSDPRLSVTMQPGASRATYPAPQPPPDDRQQTRKQLEAERERRDYNSLFASNVALSYRKDSQEKPEPASPMPSAAVPQSNPYLYAVPPNATTLTGTPTAAPTQGPGADHPPDRPRSASDPGPHEQRPAETQSPHRPAIDPELAKSDGKTYWLLEGTLLETTLTNRLNGSLAGPVNTMLSTDVYSHDRQHILIPQGSRILGEVKPVASFGQQRLAVVFHRVIMPDGYSVSLDQFHGLNQIGETGLRDQVNNHYAEIFGVSIAIGAIAGLAQANTQYGFTESATDVYRQGFAASLSQSSLRILDRFLNILPTFTIREGHRIKIYLANDLQLPAYDRHNVSNDF
jgi:type IV secretion system protein VirB10